MQDRSSTDSVLNATGWQALAPLQAMAGFNKAMSAILDFNGTLCARMAVINGDWAAFVGKRMKEDFKLCQQLAACRGPDQLFEVYSSFVQQAFRQYEAEFVHMLKLGQAFASQNADFLKGRIETTLHEEAETGPAALQRAATHSADRRQLDSAA